MRCEHHFPFSHCFSVILNLSFSFLGIWLCRREKSSQSAKSKKRVISTDTPCLEAKERFDVLSFSLSFSFSFSLSRLPLSLSSLSLCSFRKPMSSLRSLPTTLSSVVVIWTKSPNLPLLALLLPQRFFLLFLLSLMSCVLLLFLFLQFVLKKFAAIDGRK